MSLPTRVPARAAALGVVVLVLGLGGCERDYVYRPTVGTTSAVAGRFASYFSVPPEAPRGSVQLATFGFAGLRATSDDDKELRAIHLRMIVANNSAAPWRIDTREQLLALPDHGESRPAFASSDAGTAPIVDVPPGAKRTIDLFYPLPEHMQEAKDLPSFDTIWKVQTDARLVVERTPFERLEVVPRYAYDSPYDDWGYGYYYDPLYPRGGAFVGVRFAPAYGHRTVVIHSGGHGGHGGGHGRR